MRIRWPAAGLALRGIWHRRVLSAMVLLVASVAVAATTMGTTYGAAGGTAVLRTALREAPPQDQSVVLVAGEWRGQDSPTPDDVLRFRTAEILERSGGDEFFAAPIAGLEFADRFDSAAGAGRLTVVARDGMCEQVTIVSGRCPAQPGEVLASTRTLTEVGWELGDEVLPATFGSVTTPDGPTTVPLAIVGTYGVPDYADRYWIDRGARYFPPQFGRAFQVEGAVPRYDALLTPAGTFALGDLPLAEVIGSAHVTLLVDPAAVVGGDTDRLRAVIADLRGAQAQRGAADEWFAAVLTNLDAILADATAAQDAFAAPAFLVTLQVVLLAWVLLFVLVTSIVNAREAEIGLARLRGLPAFAVHRFALGEIVTLLVLSVPVGTAGGILAGWLLADRLGPSIPIEVSPLSVLAAGIAAAGGLAAAVLAARGTLSRTVSEQWQGTRARRERRSWVPDAIVLVVAVAGFAELSTGGLLGGDAQHSTLTLLAPGLFALAAAVLVARLLPIGARLAFPLTRRHGGIGGFLAARRVGRGAGTAATLVVLTTSLGLVTFATAAWTSSRASHRDVALTHVGTDTVLTVEPADAQHLADTVERVDPDGNEAMAVLARQPEAGSREAALIGVDPSRFAAVAFWRDDYAADPVAALLGSIETGAATAARSAW